MCLSSCAIQRLPPGPPGPPCPPGPPGPPGPPRPPIGPRGPPWGPPMGPWGGYIGGRLLRRKRPLSSDAPTAAPAMVAAVFAVSEVWVVLVWVDVFEAVSAAVVAVFAVTGAPQLGQNLAVELIWEPQYSQKAIKNTSFLISMYILSEVPKTSRICEKCSHYLCNPDIFSTSGTGASLLPPGSARRSCT